MWEREKIFSLNSFVFPNSGRMEKEMISGTPVQDLYTKRRLASLDLDDRTLLERFVTVRDEAAFEVLVRRHGPMVLGVCRRVLGNVQDAEDAFQATFLVLARRAHSLRNRDLLANWLYGVANRSARKARAIAARRSFHERQASPMATSALAPNEEDWGETRALLDKELEHLPSKYRMPLILCYLEGMTNEEAAAKLGWPVGSMSYRLARGRELLRQRLAQRGHALPSAAFAVMLARNTAPSTLPSSLVKATVDAALGNGAHSRSVAILLDAILKSMSRFRLAAYAVLLAAILLGLTIGGMVYAFSDRSPRSATQGESPTSVAPAPTPCH